MSKCLLLILSLWFLIVTVYCPSSCEDKYLYNYNNPNDKDDPFIDGSERLVWNHAHSCNTLQVKEDGNSSCCYLHLEYKSEITGERYDKYGCIDVKNPWEDYGGQEENAETRADEVMNFLTNTSLAQGAPDNKEHLVSSDNLHAKILCNANFLRLSLSSLLILILF